MAERGASGGGSGGDSLDKSITLPPDEIFRNLENAKRFAIDIGRHGPGTQESGRSSGRGRPASGGGGKDEGRGRGPCAQPHGSPHSLSGLIVCAASRCGTERAVGLQLPAFPRVSLDASIVSEAPHSRAASAVLDLSP
ncbi:4'-phosphopantetheine phosphatase isoform 7 [Mus musculus]|uniref:4'-phosphopantetheine phosphatase isoform 7 n=1 Tax=Mus musculus TaxID=10090 RepID=UPI002009B6EE|nr:4'-phosphopantetheine phosphatase isoform 7 [Mus musculus]